MNLIEVLEAMLVELRAIRKLLEPEPEPEQPRFDPVAATASANSVAELKAAGLWRRK